jgi:addiction module HigA family antidote
MAMRSRSTSNRTTKPREYMVTERPARCPTRIRASCSAKILADALKLSVAEAARQLGVSRMTLHRVLRGAQAVTPEMALRLGKVCGDGPEIWLRMPDGARPLAPGAHPPRRPRPHPDPPRRVI